MDSTTKFKILFEKNCKAMESFEIIERLLKIKSEKEIIKFYYDLNDGYDEPLIKVYLDDINDEYLKIFDDHIYFRIQAQRLAKNFKPNYIFQSGCFFNNDENGEYYDKIIDILWENNIKQQ